MNVTSFRLTLEKTSLWLLEKMTVGLSLQANTFIAEADWNVFSAVGFVPSVTFFFPVRQPGLVIVRDAMAWRSEWMNFNQILENEMIRKRLMYKSCLLYLYPKVISQWLIFRIQVISLRIPIPNFTFIAFCIHHDKTIYLIWAWLEEYTGETVLQVNAGLEEYTGETVLQVNAGLVLTRPYRLCCQGWSRIRTRRRGRTVNTCCLQTSPSGLIVARSLQETIELSHCSHLRTCDQL